MEKGGFEKSSPDAYADLFCYLPTTSIRRHHRRLTASTLVKTLIIKRHRNFYLLQPSLDKSNTPWTQHYRLMKVLQITQVQNIVHLYTFDKNTNTEKLS